MGRYVRNDYIVFREMMQLNIRMFAMGFIIMMKIVLHFKILCRSI